MLNSTTGTPKGLAKFFLEHIPKDDRSQTVKDFATSAFAANEPSTISFLADLLSHGPHFAARWELRNHLFEMVLGGQFNEVADICEQHRELEDSLLEKSFNHLYAIVKALRTRDQIYEITVSLPQDEELDLDDLASAEPVLPPNTDEQARLATCCLSFVRLILRSDKGLAMSMVQVGLLECGITLLGSSNEAIYKSAEAFVSTFISQSGSKTAEIVINGGESPVSLFQWYNLRIWERIESLAGNAWSNPHRTLGFNLWLRWISMSDTVDLKILLQQDSYWELLNAGLQKGDSERRKACLHILRRSIAMAVKHDEVSFLICNEEVSKACTLTLSSCAPSPTFSSDVDQGLQRCLTLQWYLLLRIWSIHTDTMTAADAMLAQYGRYCTVFETIVLGRYLNQVEECKADLDFLASDESAIPKRWLNALLSAALDNKMQDANRKFIGNWIMEAFLQPDRGVDDYAVLLRSSLLPWAAQVFLFTSSLRRVSGELRSIHGDRLANYIERLLSRKSTAECAMALLEALLSYLHDRRNGSMAYAGVYMLEGIVKAFETCNIALSVDQINRALDVAQASGLPEVARDYYVVACWTTVETSLQILDVAFPGADSVQNLKRSKKWTNLRIRFDSLLSGAADGLTYGGHAKNLLDLYEGFRAILDRDQPDLTAANVLHTVLQPVWDGVEAQELPRRPLMLMPQLIFHPTCLKRALADANLANFIVDRLHQLHSLAESRAYLFSPLVSAIRNAVISMPEAANVLPLEEFIVRIADQPPSPRMEMLLENATSVILSQAGPAYAHLNYKHYFGSRISHGFAAFFDLVSRLGLVHGLVVPKRIFERLSRPWLEQKVPIPVVSKWKTTLQLQTMLMLNETLQDNGQSNTHEQTLKSLHKVLSIEPLPRHRYLLEWMIARTYVKHYRLRHGILDLLATKDHHSNPKYLASIMKIAVMLARTDGSSEHYASRLATAIIPLAASSKVVIRHEAQWSFPILLEHARMKGWSSITANPAFAALDDYIRSLERFEDPPPGRALEKFDPVKDHTLTILVEGGYLQLDPPETPLTTRDDLLSLHMDVEENKRLLESGSHSCMPLGEAITTPKPVQPELDARIELTQLPSKPAVSISAKSVALQTKGTAYLAQSLSGEEHEQPRSEDLIVIGSLVDNPYNLGGLSRVSEIFSVAALYLTNPKVTSNKDFTSVAVSSHLHLPILPLAAAELPNFLAQKKLDGYTAVGIEQTDRSLMLGEDDARIPKRTVLVLGSEKEGIPATVLAECDLLVEVPQSGVTRSLNIQTAAAVVLYEYAKQHRQR